MFRVIIDPIRADENLQISKQMSDHEQNQNDPRDRDDHFFSNRRPIESRYNIHAIDLCDLPNARVERVVLDASPN
jgi:hypothetical protein